MDDLAKRVQRLEAALVMNRAFLNLLVQHLHSLEGHFSGPFFAESLYNFQESFAPPEGEPPSESEHLHALLCLEEWRELVEGVEVALSSASALRTPDSH